MQLQVTTSLLWSPLSGVSLNESENSKDTRPLTRVRWPFLRVPDGFPSFGRFRCLPSLTLSRPLSGFSPAWGFFQTSPLVYNQESPLNLKPSSIYNLRSWSVLLQWLWLVLFTSQTCRSCLFSRFQRVPPTEVLCFFGVCLPLYKYIGKLVPTDSPVTPSAVKGFYGFLVILPKECTNHLCDLTALRRCTIELFSQPDGVVPIQEMRGLY